MKLTKQIRDAFVASVMADVPKADRVEQLRTMMVQYALSNLPVAVRALYQDEATRGYIKTCFTTLPNGGPSVSVPGHTGYSSFSLGQQSELTRILDQHKAAERERQTLEDKIRGAANSVNTLDQLKVALPDLRAYMPAAVERATQSLTVIDVADSLREAGWRPRQAVAA